MAALGAAIVNDAFYPTLTATDAGTDAPDAYQNPLKLLAKRLAFVDPLSGRQHAFESRLTL